MIWSEAMLHRLKQLRTATPPLSFRAATIALNAEFNVSLTSNACIGMAHRIGLPTKDGKPRTPQQPAHRRRRVKVIRVDAPIVPEQPRLVPGSVSIDGLRDGICKWPLGGTFDRPPYAYCGEAAREGRSYCEDHCNTAYSRPRILA